jgi:hypothetical protein
MLQLVHLVFDLLKPAKRSKRRFMDRRAGLELNMLVQQSQLDAARTDHVAAIRCLLTSDETKDRALSGAVSTNKSYVFSRIHLQRGASQDILNTVGLMNF